MENNNSDREVNIFWLIFWVLFFWPMALIYVLMKKL